jgi:hypothetical protein
VRNGQKDFASFVASEHKGPICIFPQSPKEKFSDWNYRLWQIKWGKNYSLAHRLENYQGERSFMLVGKNINAINLFLLVMDLFFFKAQRFAISFSSLSFTMCKIIQTMQTYLKI